MSTSIKQSEIKISKVHMDLWYTYGLFEQTVRAVELLVQQMVKAEGGEVRQNRLSRRGEENPTVQTHPYIQTSHTVKESIQDKLNQSDITKESI